MSRKQKSEIDVEAFRAWCSDTLDAFVAHALVECDAGKDSTALLSVLYEALGENLGNIDALACLSGVSRPDRDKMLRACFTTGKRGVLVQHRATCPSCDAGKALERELDEVQ